MAQLLTNKHYEAFGRIIYAYAAVEVGIKFCVSGMLKTSYHVMMVALATITATNLANTAKSLANDTLKKKQASQMIALANRWMAFNDLRMRIAHHRWTAGKRPGSIKATFFDVRQGKTILRGFLDDEPDYTAAELTKIANDLSQLNNDVKAFLAESGLRAIIDLKMAESKAETEGSGGRD